jgi:hypothetical protein
MKDFDYSHFFFAMVRGHDVVNSLMDLAIIIFAVDKASEELSTIAHVNVGDKDS